jgi:hypothetical protein
MAARAPAAADKSIRWALNPGREACKLKAILRNGAASAVEALNSVIVNAFVVKASAYNSKT